MIRADVQGLEETSRGMAASLKNARARVRRAVTESTIELQRAVKQALSGPVLHVVTGRLRRSITQRVYDKGETIRGVVGTNVEYARYHEYGFNGTVYVRSSTRGKKTVRAHTRRVHYKGRPFMAPTLASLNDSIRRRIVEALK